jgi:hypothetical protein
MECWDTILKHTNEKLHISNFYKITIKIQQKFFPFSDQPK